MEFKAIIGWGPEPSPLHVYLVGVAVVFLFFTVVWLASLKKRDVSIIDIFWGPAFVLAAFFFLQGNPAVTWYHEGSGDPPLSPWTLIYLGLVALWGLRLAIHIGARHKGEDYRYQAMRKKTGPSFAFKSLFRVFWLQAALVAIICLPHFFIQTYPRPTGALWSDWVALGLFAIGFFFEAVGDWQLQRFRDDPANQGKVLRTGLWRYTRHPNYFGDATLWLGFFFAALAAPLGWTSFVSFALELFLLLKVSGVVLLEKTIVQRRPEYEDYIRATPAFFPWFPKPSKEAE
jgi:steroid 5-alpha reductase family enzyme